MATWHPNIFDFLDYRAYLKAWYDAGKESTRAMSYRYLARRAGFASPSYLRDVIIGRKNLGADSVDRLLPVLELNGRGEEYFRALVAFSQAETSADKNAAFAVVAAARRFKNARRIDEELYSYLSHWYYPAIREMAARRDFDADPEWIAPRLMPPISVAQAASALETLFDLGMLVRDDDGRVRRAEVSVTTEHEVQNLALGNYHRQMLERAAASIELVASRNRDLAAMTVCVSPDTVAELKRRIHAFRELVLELCDSDTEPAIVCQFNSQLFPLTNPSDLPDEDHV